MAAEGRNAAPSWRNGTARWRHITVRLGDAVAGVCVRLAALALLGIVAINGMNVVARYVFGAPFSWAEELMLFLMIFAVFAGAVAITWRNQHVRIATIIERTPRLLQRFAKVLASIACIVVLATVAAASFNLVSLLQSFDQRSDALQAPMWIPQSFVTVGLGLMAVLIAVRLVLANGAGRHDG
jgi:TRAP-type C4-dicarboxylate transport system permease small subunit